MVDIFFCFSGMSMPMQPKKVTSFSLQTNSLNGTFDSTFEDTLTSHYHVIVKFSDTSDLRFGLRLKLRGMTEIIVERTRDEIFRDLRKEFLKIDVPNAEMIGKVESIELDCPKQTHDWVEYIYVSPLNRRGTFFSLGQLNKKTQKVTVYPGAVYVIKIRTRPDISWSGPAALRIHGDRDQTETIEIAAVSNIFCTFIH